MQNRFFSIKLFIVVVVLQSAIFISAQDFTPITPDNITQLELGYAVPGYSFFEGFSPDGRLLLSNNLYEENNTIYLRVDGNMVFKGDMG